MQRNEKLEISKKLSERLSNAKAIILTEYRGMKVSEVTELRREVRKNAGEIKVVKNRLVRKAIAGTPWAGLDAHLKGPVALAISDQDPVVLAKVLFKFSENFPTFKITVGSLDGKALTPKEIEALSKLPSKEELYAKLLGTLMGPATRLVRVLNAVPQKVVTCLNQISEKKSQ